MADEVGCNAIDFDLYNFQPDHDGFISGTDVRTSFGFYEPPAPADRLQIRCWRKGDHPVDLASSGGHEARFDGRRVFPIRFVLRHYPIRGQVHGVRKVISERRARFNLRERERGWHVQYDGIDEQTSFIRPQAELVPFNAVESRRALPIATAAVMDFERTIGELRAELRTAEDATLRAEDRAADRQAALQAQLDSTSAEFEARTAARDPGHGSSSSNRRPRSMPRRSPLCRRQSPTAISQSSITALARWHLSSRSAGAGRRRPARRPDW